MKMNDIKLRTITVSVYQARQQALLDIVSTMKRYAWTISTDSTTITMNMEEIQKCITEYILTYITASYREGYPFTDTGILGSVRELFYQLYWSLIIEEIEKSDRNISAVQRHDTLCIRDEVKNFEQLVQNVQILESFRYVTAKLENNINTQVKLAMDSFGITLAFDNFVAAGCVCNLPQTDILITVKI